MSDPLYAWEDSHFHGCLGGWTEATARKNLKALCRRYQVPEPLLEFRDGPSCCENSGIIRLSRQGLGPLELAHEFAHLLQAILERKGLIHVAGDGHGGSFMALLILLMSDCFYYDVERAVRSAREWGLEVWEVGRARELVGSLGCRAVPGAGAV